LEIDRQPFGKLGYVGEYFTAVQESRVLYLERTTAYLSRALFQIYDYGAGFFQNKAVSPVLLASDCQRNRPDQRHDERFEQLGELRAGPGPGDLYLGTAGDIFRYRNSRNGGVQVRLAQKGIEVSSLRLFGIIGPGLVAAERTAPGSPPGCRVNSPGRNREWCADLPG